MCVCVTYLVGHMAVVGGVLCGVLCGVSVRECLVLLPTGCH